MDIFEPLNQLNTSTQEQEQNQHDHDLISFNTQSQQQQQQQQQTQQSTLTTNGLSNSNNNINNSLSQNSTSSGYYSGRSTPNTLLNRLNNKLHQQLLPSIDDYLFDSELYMINKSQQQTPKHQQQLQLLNDEIQNRLFNTTTIFNTSNGLEQPITNSYRSLSLNNVILQSPKSINNQQFLNHNNFQDISYNNPNLQYHHHHHHHHQQQQQQSLPNYISNNNRRERSLDRSLSTTLLTPSTSSTLTRQRSLSVNKTQNRDDRSDLFKRDLSTNSIKSLINQPTQQQNNKINLSKEIQIKIVDMQKEINYLKCELELTSQKLQSSIQSIKTFWSPELKKERQARKEETAKYQNLYEKYKILVSNSTNNNDNLLNLSPLSNNNNIDDDHQQQQQSSPILNLNKLIKENNLLKKTISELELRINTQKQVFYSKDETIKNLLILLNNNKETQQQQQQQQQTVDLNSNIELNELKENLNNTIEQQTQHIKYLESQNQILQDEIKLIQQSPLQSNATTITTQNQIELYKQNEKFLKEKIESIKFELNRKDNDYQTLKTRYESIESKEKDLQHYLNLLKESISTKDQQLLIVQSEINDLRNRLRDKEKSIEKKTQQIQTFQLDKHQRDSDLLELKDQMDIKDRKLNVLNRKIDNLEEQLKDKEMQIQTLRSKIGTNINNNFSNEIINLEQVIDEKEKLIEKLNQSKLTSKDELNRLNVNIQELKEINEKKDKEIIDFQNEILDLKDEISILKTQLIHKDSHVNSLELSLTQKNDEIEKIEEKLNRLKQQQQFSTTQNDTNKKQLQKELQSKETQLNETLKELNILKDIISNFEIQKEEMMNKLEQQQQVFDDLQVKYEQNIIKLQETNSNSQTDIQTQHRINELEDALRQSVAITAEREIVMAKQKTKFEKIENENKYLLNENEKMKKYLNEQHFQFERLQEDFIKREEQLQQLEEEKVKEMNDILIAKQEALLTAISEKDANIANLEVDNNKTQPLMNEINRLYEEKDNLHQQLKQLNEKRMKLMQDHIQSKDSKDKVKMLVLSIKTANDEDGLYA